MAILHPKPVKHLKVLFKGGVNPAVGSLAAGTRITIRNKGRRVK